MDKSKIGKQIRTQRLLNDLTVAQLAEKADISDNYLGNIERGKQIPSLKIMLVIANELDISMDYILGDNLQYNRKVTDNDVISKDLTRLLADMDTNQKSILFDCAKSILKHYPD